MAAKNASNGIAVRLLLGLGLFQRNDLRLGQHEALLGALGFWDEAFRRATERWRSGKSISASGRVKQLRRWASVAKPPDA